MSPDKRRRYRLSVRLSRSELELLREAATQTALPLSSYTRMVVLEVASAAKKEAEA